MLLSARHTDVRDYERYYTGTVEFGDGLVVIDVYFTVNVTMVTVVVIVSVKTDTLVFACFLEMSLKGVTWIVVSCI